MEIYIVCCYDTIIFQYAIDTDEAGVQPMVATLVIHRITWITTPTLEVWKAELVNE